MSKKQFSIRRDSPSASRRPLVWGLLLGLIAVAGIAAYVFWPSDSGDDQEKSPVVAAAAVSDGPLRVIPGVDPETYLRRIAPSLAQVDPSLDGWDTEVVSGAASAQFKKLAAMLTDSSGIDPSGIDSSGIDSGRLKAVVSPNFRAGPLRPTGLREVFRDGSVVVSRGPSSGKNSLGENSLGQEAATIDSNDADAAGNFSQLMSPLHQATDRRIAFKIIRVLSTDDGFETRVLFQSSGKTSEGIVQQSATWTCLWSTGKGNDSPPRLVSITTADYEEIHPAASGGIEFVDWTQSVFGDQPSFRQQLLFGIDHWRNRLQRDYDLDFTGHHGIAVGDANGDGLDDLYVCQPGGLPNRLYFQQPDGTLRDVSAASHTNWMELSHSALFVDLNNDGMQDLVITQNRKVIIMRNEGGGLFSSRLVARGPALFMSSSAVDYDNDGDLDLFFCGYSPRRGFGGSTDQAEEPLPYHDANNGGPNILLRNHGNFRFSDVTRTVGLDENNRRFSFAASWEDYDNDGDMDLYVANDFGRNNLYRNDSGKFIDVAAQAGVEDISAGMGVTWGDYDGDGLMDLYVSNMFSSAGGRISYQRKFRESDNQETLSHLQRHARGNTLFRNQGDGTFADVSVDSAVTMGRWAWGAKFVDLNNDGRQDIFVPNGYITSETSRDL